MLHFTQDVIARSQTVPVVVDFWAPWCGPCRVLGPTIEALAAEAGGRWELVKVNTEEEPALAQRYQIMSIPAVKLFVRGEVVAEFAGALSRPQIEAWLEVHLPDPRRDQLVALIDALHHGDAPAAAQQALTTLVTTYPDLVEGRIKLAALETRTDPEAARARIADIRPGHKLAEAAEDIRRLADLMTCEAEDTPALAEKLITARQAWAAGQSDPALKHLIDAVMIDKSYGDDLPRRATLAIFRFLGEDHSLTKQYRPFFSMALY